ncbi:TIGR04211 family SH3 domain-containing protein [uncultured Succinatimonas sp.]|uniref:TIGR04211 family SH3 domain-containing protein n=1 Tax=uncultured Succinatimonas sp. TaxID=1262973 RepID=UPI0025DDFF05|nr:TIGR04211 family SH3 domain-containing protein [uncultured Succinatimonas sp.]
MFKSKAAFSLIVALLCLFSSAFAAETETPQTPTPGVTVYVSDHNRIWTRSGPTTRHRITGSARIGDKLTFLEASGKFYKVRNENGKEFWMQADTLQVEPCGYTLTEDLQKQVNNLTYKLENYDTELSRNYQAAKKRLERLEKENAGMKEAILQKDATIQQLDEQRRSYAESLETKDLDMQMRWWMQGAMIALGGAILGAIFIFIPRPRLKRRRDRY